jgi:hypothetical protein
MVKRILKRWKWWLLVLLLLPLVLLGVAQWILSSMLTPDALVARLEATYNCRAEVTSASADLWSRPAKVTLVGLKLSPRDADADQATPLAQRQPSDSKKAILSLANASLTVDLWSLLKRDLNVKDLLLQNVSLATTTSMEGINNFNIMMSKPALVAGKPNPALQAVAQDPNATPESKTTSGPFTVKDLPLASSLGSAKLENLRMDFRSDKKRQNLRFENVAFSLTDVQIDANNLAQENQLAFQLDGDFFIIGKRKFEHANLGVQLSGKFQPFDAKTGQLAPMRFHVALEKDSKLREIAAIERISQKMKKWERYGLTFKPLPAEVIVLKDCTADFVLAQPKLSVDSDLTLFFDNYEVILQKGGWIDLDTNECKLDLYVIGSQSVSQQALQDFNDSLKKKIGDTIGSTLGEKVTKLFKKESLILADGRLSVPIGLTGDLSKPEVEDRVTPILENALLELVLSGLN